MLSPAREAVDICHAATRELHDAVCIPAAAVVIIDAMPLWLHYEYPVEVQRQKLQAGRSNWKGQRVVRTVRTVGLLVACVCGDTMHLRMC